FAASISLLARPPWFLTGRPPPTATTVFPYTTLFRSPEHAVCRLLEARRLHGALRGGRCAGKRPELCSAPFHPSEPGRRILQKRPDRKSTRLNSSHVSISYAVFCLKKKKRQQT